MTHFSHTLLWYVIDLITYRSLLGKDSGFAVPMVIPELSTRRVLTSELIQGVPLDSCTELPQDVRNDVCGNFNFGWGWEGF